METTATKPLTHKHIQNALDALKQPKVLSNMVLMSQSDFAYTMVCAKHYAGKQIVKRNYHIKTKKNRYRKTQVIPHLKVTNERCIEAYGMKFIPSEY